MTVRFGGITALDHVGFDVAPGTICGLIGPNGAGKTTLFNCISRLYTPDEGTIHYGDADLLAYPPHRIAELGIARTFQNLGLFAQMSVRDNVMLGRHHRTRTSFVTAPLRLPAVRREEAAVRAEADALLERLGLRHLADHPASGLPFGTLKRIEIARALASDPSLLLLDEPAGGLTHSEVDGLATAIQSIRDDFGLTILVVEHHMGFVMQMSEQVVCLEFGRRIADGTPEEVQRDPQVIAAYLGTGA